MSVELALGRTAFKTLDKTLDKTDLEVMIMLHVFLDMGPDILAIGNCGSQGQRG